MNTEGRLPSARMNQGMKASFFMVGQANPRRNEAIVEIFRSGRALYLFPLTLLLMLATAGFTEEFFFRGI